MARTINSTPDQTSKYLRELKHTVRNYIGRGDIRVFPTIRHIQTDLAHELRVVGFSNQVSFVVAHLEAAVDAVKADMEIEARSQLASKLAYDPASAPGGQAALKAYAAILLYRAATPDELAVLSHFLWLVKRHVNGQRAMYHMMPVIVGPQGCGKTETLKQLLQAGLGSYCLTTNFQYLEDERNTPALARNFVVFLDEMAKVNKTDVGNLKRLLTQETLTYRPMRTNDELSVKNNVTLIGASNDNIESLIKDKEMRRFYGLQVDVEASNKMGTMERMRHWQQLDKVDMLAIWRSVDEAAGLLPEFAAARDSIAATQQADLTASDMFIEWIEAAGYVGSDTKKVEVTEMMKEYRTFLTELGSYHDAGIDPKAFRAKLKGAGISVVRTNNKYRALAGVGVVKGTPSVVKGGEGG